MKTKSILFVVFLFTCLLSQESREFRKSEMMSYDYLQKANKNNYPGDPNIDVSFYKLHITILYDIKKILGETRIDAVSLIDGLNSINLELINNFSIDSIKMNNIKVNFTHSSDKIHIELDSAYNLNKKISLTIYYYGSPGSTGFGSFQFYDSRKNKTTVWSLSQPYGARDWWPSKNDLGDKADSSEVWITGSNYFNSVSNGVLTEVIDNPDKSKTYKWKNKYPIADYLISIAMCNYVEIKDYFHYSPKDSMLVIHYVYPGEDTDANKSALKRTLDALSIFSDLFGPYPWLDQKYGHVRCGFGGGMEHQTVASMGGYSELLIVHELAHQWFGDLITCRDWQNIWLNEGFATFAEGLYLEKMYGWNRYTSYIADEMSWAKPAVGTIYVQDISTKDEIFDSRRSYSKGGVVLHMLRGVVGDSVFFRALKKYATDTRFMYGNTVTEDFQGVMETESGQDLDYFFNEWIYGENYPKYTSSWYSIDLGNGNYRVKLSINQNQNSNPMFFTMPIQVAITTSAMDTLVTLFNNQQKQYFEIDVIGQPVSLVLDPNNWILKESTLTTDIPNETIPEKYILYQNYPNPFNPSTKIKYVIPDVGAYRSAQGGTPVQLKIYDILGNEVATLVNEVKEAGIYEVDFPNSLEVNSTLPSGIYFYQLRSGNFTSTMQMLLMK